MPHSKVVARMDPAALCELLFRVGRKLPPELRVAIADRGSEVVMPLLDIARDDGLWWQGEHADWARRHALMLLKEVPDARAVEPLVVLLVWLWKLEGAWLLADGAVQALQAQGERALEPVMAALEATEDEEVREVLVDVLAALGVRDPRIWDQLVAQLARAPDRGAGGLSEFGDESALPLLHEALARAPILPPDERGRMANRDFIEIEEAILHLGGELTPEEEARSEILRALYSRRKQDVGELADT